MARGRYVDHGNDVWCPPLSVSANRKSNRTNRRILAQCHRRGRGSSLARLFVRQSTRNFVLARWSRSHSDAARLGLSNDAHLRAVRPVVLQIRSLQQKRCCRKSADLSAERQPFADDRENSAETRGDDQWLGGRSECNLPF